MVGFTRAADPMEAEDLAALWNECLSEMAAIADCHRATVNQFVGDGIIAFFGAPDATEGRDHALRGVRMALEMRRRMLELGAKWFAGGIQTPLGIRIGINAGVSSVGDFGSEGHTLYSAIGTQTNLAARIQDHCEPGRVAHQPHDLGTGEGRDPLPGARRDRVQGPARSGAGLRGDGWDVSSQRRRRDRWTPIAEVFV